MTYEQLNAAWAPETLADPIGVPHTEIAFYPGFDEQYIAEARAKAIDTIWNVSTGNNQINESEESIACKLDFAREQHFLGIKHRDNGDINRAQDYFSRAEQLARNYGELNLLSETLAHQVDLYITFARNSHGFSNYAGALSAMQNAVEAFTYAQYLGREDLNWFGWKIFEAACETKNWKYAAHYWFVTTGLELDVVKSFPGTLNYGTNKVKAKIKEVFKHF